MERTARLSERLPAVRRLGLATRGGSQLEAEDVAWAVERGVRYLNWCGHPDGLSRYLAQADRSGLVVAAQLQARSAEAAARELDEMAEALGGPPDIATLYYIESEQEWAEVCSAAGAWEELTRRRAAGSLGLIGLTTHQRKLGARWAQESSPEGERRLDLLMIRYNAAHRGAEREVFPITQQLGIPAVCFTALRWRALLRENPERAGGWRAPTAADCYRFCLSHPAAAIVLTAPTTRAQLEGNLTLLDDWRATSAEERERIEAHGDWVRATAGESW